MGAAADDLLRDDEEREVVKHIRERKKAEAAEQEEKERNKLDLGTSLYRAKQILTGAERPTRETNEQYRRRKGH